MLTVHSSASLKKIFIVSKMRNVIRYYVHSASLRRKQAHNQRCCGFCGPGTNTTAKVAHAIAGTKADQEFMERDF